MNTKRTALADRFWSKVDKTGACWLWTGSTVNGGYGKISEGGVHGRLLLAHRVAFQIANGYEPTGMVVMHTCDNKLCVNPAHLVAGSQLDNIRDMDRKGRRVCNPVRGESHRNAKLSGPLAIEIRSRRAAGESASRLAREFDVSIALVRAIYDGKIWTHVGVGALAP